MLSWSQPKSPYVVFMFATLLAVTTFAKEVTVFDVRRPLAMDNDDHPPKDFYINAGSNDGLKPGMVIAVQRRQALYDVYQNKSPGDLIVVIGQIRIIHVQPEVSVARLDSINKSEDAPALDFDTIMVGDRVDLSTARMGPRKTAALSEGLPVEMKLDVPAPLATPAPAEKKAADFSSVTPVPSPTAAPPL